VNSTGRSGGRGKSQTQTESEPQSAPKASAQSDEKKAATGNTSGNTSRTKRTGSKATAAPDAPADGVQNEGSSALWRRLVAAVRGGVSEIGEAIADSQALRILDQEIRDNDAELHRLRIALGETLARYKVAQDKLAATERKLDEYEGYAIKALTSGEDALARELAAKIALLEVERDGEAGRVGEFADGVADLRKVVAQYEATIKRLKQQVDTVRATDSVQRAQSAVASRRDASDTRVRTALDSLERIKRRQAEHGARLQANEDTSLVGDDEMLQAKLRRAGIIADDDRAASVLSRLRKRQDDAS
jgi:phage shock protein A